MQMVLHNPMAESKELKSLLMKVKEESEKSGLKLNNHKTKIMASGAISSWQIGGKTIALSNGSTKVYTDFCWQSDVSFFSYAV